MIVGAHIIDNKPIMYNPWGRIINDELWPTSSSNSEGVAITQPRVEGRSTSTLGMNTTLLSYSVRVALSRRRYTQSVIIVLHRFSHNPQRRALKNHRYFHFIGVVRRHYRAFTRRSGYDVW